MKLNAIWFVAPAVLLLLGANTKPSCACSTRERAYVPAMKSDLKNLSTAQEAFRADSNRYAASFAELTPAMYRSTSGVTVTLDSGSARGWSARASHTNTPATCTITTTVVATSPTDGELICDETDNGADAPHRFRFFAFLGITAFVGITAALGHGRWSAFVALLVLSGLNPYWLDPSTGMDCGSSVRTMSKVWLGIAGAIAAWQRFRGPVQSIDAQ